MSTTDGHTHLEDGDLVRLLGDELSADERAAAEAHLGRCDVCAARLDACRAEIQDVRRLLDALPVGGIDPARRARSLAAVREAAVRQGAVREATDRDDDVRHAAPDPRFARRRRFIPSTALARAAAVAALLVAGGVAASPAGAWIVDRVRDLFQPSQPVATADPAPSSMSAHSSVVAFTPVGAELIVEFRTAQVRGDLVLRVEDTPSASAKVSGGEGDLDVIVLPGSLTIQNDHDVIASYEVIIPASLDRLRIRVGDAEEMLLRPRALGPGWSAVVGLQHGSIDAHDEGL